MPAATKRCVWCDRTLDIDRFSRNRAHRDGRQSYCKDCYRNYRRGYDAAQRSLSRQGA